MPYYIDGLEGIKKPVKWHLRCRFEALCFSKLLVSQDFFFPFIPYVFSLNWQLPDEIYGLTHVLSTPCRKKCLLLLSNECVVFYYAALLYHCGICFLKILWGFLLYYFMKPVKAGKRKGAGFKRPWNSW